MSVNNVVLSGRLAGDPELRYFQDGTGQVQFKLAVQRDYKNKQGEREADFVPIVARDRGNYKLAEWAANDLAKGQQCTVVGKIKVRNFDGQDGKKVWITEVEADKLDYAKNGQALSSEGGNHPEDDCPF